MVCNLIHTSNGVSIYSELFIVYDILFNNCLLEKHLLLCIIQQGTCNKHVDNDSCVTSVVVTARNKINSVKQIFTTTNKNFFSSFYITYYIPTHFLN